MWGHGVYGEQILVLVHKFTFKVVFGIIFSRRLSLLLNIQIEKSDNFDPQFLQLAPPLGCKNMQNWKKGCVFGHIDKVWKGHDGQIKKNACKTVYFGVYFYT